MTFVGINIHKAMAPHPERKDLFTFDTRAPRQFPCDICISRDNGEAYCRHCRFYPKPEVPR